MSRTTRTLLGLVALSLAIVGAAFLGSSGAERNADLVPPPATPPSDPLELYAFDGVTPGGGPQDGVHAPLAPRSTSGVATHDGDGGLDAADSEVEEGVQDAAATAPDARAVEATTRAPASKELALALLEKGDVESLYEARRMLSELLLRSPSAEDRQVALTGIAKANQVLIYAPDPCPGATIITVKSGDTLGRIAKESGQSLDLIMAINGIKNANHIRIGQRIKVLDGVVSLVVERDHLRMTAYIDDDVIAEYDVGIGAYGRTPEGEFEIITRQEEPDWYKPNGGVVRYGEPGHLIGTRWLGFRPTSEYQGYGIHGTNDPTSVPGRESLGCIRMRNADVEALYPLVAAGTKVRIQ